MGYVYLTVAVFAEVIATNALKASEAFIKPLPSVITILGYTIAFYCLSVVVKSIPLGMAYAIWSGLGIVLVTIVAMLWFKQTPDLPAILGMAMIILGTMIMVLFSKTISH